MLSGFDLGMGLKESFHLTGLSNLWIFFRGIGIFIVITLDNLAITLTVIIVIKHISFRSASNDLKVNVLFFTDVYFQHFVR